MSYRRHRPHHHGEKQRSDATGAAASSQRTEYGEPRTFIRWQQDFPYIQFGVADAPLTDDTRSIDDSLQWPCPLCRTPITHGQTIFGLEGVPIHAECLDHSLDAVLRRKAKKMYMMRQRQKMLIERERRRQGDGGGDSVHPSSHERKSQTTSQRRRQQQQQQHAPPPRPRERGEPLRDVARRVGRGRKE